MHASAHAYSLKNNKTKTKRGVIFHQGGLLIHQGSAVFSFVQFFCATHCAHISRQSVTLHFVLFVSSFSRFCSSSSNRHSRQMQSASPSCAPRKTSSSLPAPPGSSSSAPQGPASSPPLQLHTQNKICFLPWFLTATETIRLIRDG